MCNAKGPRCFHLFRFAACNISLSLYFLCAALLGRCLMALVSATSWGLHQNQSFMFTASWSGLLGLPAHLGPAFWDSPATGCLVSTTHWNDGSRFMNPSLLPFKLFTLSSHGWHGQVLLLVWDVLPANHIKIFLGAENSLGLFIVWNLSRVGSCSEGTLPFIPDLNKWILFEGTKLYILFSTSLGWNIKFPGAF